MPVDQALVQRVKTIIVELHIIGDELMHFIESVERHAPRRAATKEGSAASRDRRMVRIWISLVNTQDCTRARADLEADHVTKQASVPRTLMGCIVDKPADAAHHVPLLWAVHLGNNVGTFRASG